MLVMPRKIMSPKDRLSNSLRLARKAAPDGVLRAGNLPVAARKCLQQAGWLQEVCKGWYLFVNPTTASGSSEAWFAFFWSFLARYLKSRFGSRYCLSAESSLERHIECPVIPKQVTVYTKGAVSQILTLPEGTSVLIYPERNSFPAEVVSQSGLRVMPLHLAVARLGAYFFRERMSDVQTALLALPNASPLSRALLEQRLKPPAERVIKAYLLNGQKVNAHNILADFKMAGIELNVENICLDHSSVGSFRTTMYAHHRVRITLLWNQMRTVVLSVKPQKREMVSSGSILKELDSKLYQRDAYNSLSIEGYQVSDELIEKIAKGDWNPDSNFGDKEQRDGLAARGYHNAFKNVILGIEKVLLEGRDSVEEVELAYQDWYRELFAPSIRAGLLQAKDLMGFRGIPVYIKGSRHVPPRHEALPVCLETFFELLKQETDCFVRAVLGHFVFVYIHPFVDGNGRIARFILNMFLLEGGYHWAVIRVARRSAYLEALECASVNQDIEPFARFVVEEMLASQNLI
jgi:hypothetical protein